MRLISIFIIIALTSFESMLYGQVTPAIPESIQCGCTAPNVVISENAISVSFPDEADFQFRYDYCLFQAWVAVEGEDDIYDTLDFFVDWDSISIDPCKGIMLPLQTDNQFDCFILNTETGTARLILNGREFTYSLEQNICKRI